eukprot:55337_1
MMDTQRTAIYNPFQLSDRIHFPSFSAAFGDLLKIEAEYLRKESEKKGRELKPPGANKPSDSTSRCAPVTPIPSKSRCKNKTKSLSKPPESSSRCAPVTPIPSKSRGKNKQKASSHLSQSFSFHADREEKPLPSTSNTNLKPNAPKNKSFTRGDVGVTPIPNKSRKKKFKNKKLSVVVTPAPAKSKKRIPSAATEEDESLVLMMADLMSPNPNNRAELSSPAPNDKNARLLNRKPINFPIVLPETPMKGETEGHRGALEEKWCSEYFKKHVPILTPTKKRRNPVKLYDPSADTDVTMFLEATDKPFETPAQQKEANPVALLGDISMICPSADLSQIKPSSLQSNMSQIKPIQRQSPISEVKSTPFLSFGESFALGGGGDLQMSMLHTPSTPVTPVAPVEIIFENNPPPSEISKPAAVEEEDLFFSVHAMGDEEFFNTSKDYGTSITTTNTASTQTEPVLVVAEVDIPKIRFDGRPVTSMSAIYFDELSSDAEKSHCSAQSDNIIYTPILRHNKESIESLYEMSSISDSDSDAMVQSGHMMSVSYDENRKRKPSANKMLKAYKQSKLAKNPNWTVCNGYSKSGELI